MKEKEEIKNRGRLEVYGDIVEFFFPDNFASFQFEIIQLLGGDEQSFKSVTITYKDERGNKKEINDNNTYQSFIHYINDPDQKFITTVTIGLKEEESKNAENSANSIINENNNIYEQNAWFKFPCYFCGRPPQKFPVYFCNECSTIFCEGCEEKEGTSHNHSYYKIHNVEQYNYLYLNGKLTFKKITNKLEEIRDTVDKEVFWGLAKVVFYLKEKFKGKNSNTQNCASDGGEKDWATLVQMARKQYQLPNITDQQIENALKKENGKIDNAIFYLCSNL